MIPVRENSEVVIKFTQIYAIYIYIYPINGFAIISFYGNINHGFPQVFPQVFPLKSMRKSPVISAAISRPEPSEPRPRAIRRSPSRRPRRAPGNWSKDPWLLDVKKTWEKTWENMGKQPWTKIIYMDFLWFFYGFGKENNLLICEKKHGHK